jgi:hypothetical protein
LKKKFFGTPLTRVTDFAILLFSNRVQVVGRLGRKKEGLGPVEWTSLDLPLSFGMSSRSRLSVILEALF